MPRPQTPWRSSAEAFGGAAINAQIAVARRKSQAERATFDRVSHHERPSVQKKVPAAYAINRSGPGERCS